ncbi:MAG: hypothetical protein S4CHLAM20_01760 [Chlamydiia bacterium]|nr:hypothetical protein [Chlamydiia bacterium]
MWEKKHTKIYPGISKEQIWDRWKNIDNWSDWNDDLEHSKLNDTFETGGTFKLKPKGAPEVSLTLETVKEHESFTDCLHLPGAKMIGKHEMKETNEGLELTTTVSIQGMNSMLWVKLLGEKVAAKMPEQSDKLVEIAKTTN